MRPNIAVAQYVRMDSEQTLEELAVLTTVDGLQQVLDIWQFTNNSYDVGIIDYFFTQINPRDEFVSKLVQDYVNN